MKTSLLALTLAFIFTLSSEAYERKPPAAKDEVFLPVLDEGPGHGYYCYYKAKTYIAWVDERGGLLVQMLHKSGELGDPIRVCSFMQTSWLQKLSQKNHRWIRRYMREVTKAPKPTTKPTRKVTLEAKLVDDVKFRRAYSFESKKITVYTGFECKNSSKPSKYSCGVWFPPSMSFDPKTEQPDRVKALEGYEVKIKGREGGKRDRLRIFSYALNEKLLRPAKLVNATGPWKNMHLILRTKKSIMHPHLYAGNCPYQGFSVSVHVPNNSISTAKQIKYTFEISDR